MELIEGDTLARRLSAGALTTRRSSALADRSPTRSDGLSAPARTGPLWTCAGEDPIERKGGVVACVRMDMSDPTARSLCFGCGASWTNEIEGRCPDCGAALVSREMVIKEFEGSVRDPEASLPEFSSLDLLCTTTGEDELRHARKRLEEYDVAHFCFREEQDGARDGSPALTTSFYIA